MHKHATENESSRKACHLDIMCSRSPRGAMGTGLAAVGHTKTFYRFWGHAEKGSAFKDMLYFMVPGTPVCQSFMGTVPFIAQKLKCITRRKTAFECDAHFDYNKVTLTEAG